MPIFLGCLWTAFVFVSPRLSIKKQFKNARHISEEGVYDFDENQFRIARPSLQVSMPWSNIHTALETKDSFAIFTNKVCFYVIPKRFFAEGQLSFFRDLLEAALQKNGKRLLRKSA